MTVENKEDKASIVDNLIITKRKGHALEIDLMFKGKDEDAKKVKKKTEELSKKIDLLLAALMKEWIGSAEPLIQKIKKTNAGLQKAIRDIKKDVETAKNVVKALGYLDEAVKIATDLLG